MKIGIGSSTLRLPSGSIDYTTARAHGFDLINYEEITSADGILNTSEEALFARMREERARAEAAGVAFTQVHGIWPTDDKTEASCARMLEAMKRGVRCAALLGADCYVIHPAMPVGWGEDDPVLARRLTKERLIALAEVGEPLGVTVCLENMPFSAHKLSTVEETAALVREIDRSGVAVCLDTGHANMLGTSGYDMVRLCEGVLACLHVHDNLGYADFHAVPFTRGNIDWQGFRKALCEIGYKAPLVLETDFRADIPESARPHALCLMYEIAKALCVE